MNKYGSVAPLVIGCIGASFIFVFLAAIVGTSADTLFGVDKILLMFGLSITVGIAIFVIGMGINNGKRNKEDKNAMHYVASKLFNECANKDVTQEIIVMCKATYFGGHKKYADKVDIYFILSKQCLIIKELQGHSETRMNIPYLDIIDFGIASKEQLTLTRMLLVGILAFALKKRNQYLYIKYRDKLGFENNPVIGEFLDATISKINSELYALIERTKSKFGS